MSHTHSNTRASRAEEEWNRKKKLNKKKTRTNDNNYGLSIIRGWIKCQRTHVQPSTAQNAIHLKFYGWAIRFISVHGERDSENLKNDDERTKKKLRSPLWYFIWSTNGIIYGYYTNYVFFFFRSLLSPWFDCANSVGFAHVRSGKSLAILFSTKKNSFFLAIKSRKSYKKRYMTWNVCLPYEHFQNQRNVTQ